MSVALNIFYKLVFTICLVFVFRLGLYIPSPGVNLDFFMNFFSSVKNESTNLINFITSNSFGSFSLFSLGVMPYIMASIMMQLVAHSFNLQSSEFFREKSNLITRLAVVIFASFQFFMLILSKSNSSSMKIYEIFVANGLSLNILYIAVVYCSIISGCLIIVWIGEIITEYGIGNGVSMLILSNITSDFLFFLIKVFSYDSSESSIFKKVFAILLFFSVIFCIVFIEKSIRFVTILSTKSSFNKLNASSKKNYLFPMKINFSGVMPLIFANTVLMFLYSIIQKFLPSIGGYNLYFTIVYYIFLFGLLFVFSIFYSELMFNPSKVSEYLKKNDSIIVGIRPGKATANYFIDILKILTIFSVLYLFFIVAFVDSIKNIFGLNNFLNITSLLIVVLMSLDFFSKIKLEFSKSYNSFFLK
jgi:preprotein translocase subunit SecY